MSNLSRRTALAGLSAFTLLSACGERRTKERRDAIVIGAGIAGLYAATLLEELGFDVLVLEASDRVGGRMYTLDHLDGAPECGGQTVGSMYSRILSLVDRFGLEVFERKPILPGNAYYINGALMSAKDWESSPANRLAGAERAVLPNRLYGHYIKQKNPLSSLYDWRSEALLPHDAQSIAADVRAGGASEEAVRLMERWFDGGGMDNMSALFAYRKHEAAELEKPTAYRIKGGSSRLPEAMAAALKTPPRLNVRVAAVYDDGDLVTVSDEAGRQYQASHVFAAVPFSILRGMAIDPAPPPALANAINALPYNHITQVKLAFSDPFWEADGLPPALYADSFVERIAAAKGQDGALHYLNVWIKGLQAAAFDAYTDEEIGARVVAEMERIRPASKGKVTAAHVIAWGRNPNSLGAYHFFGVGGAGAYGDVLLRPHGRLSFIGEHAAEFQQGMEGACESAEREVFAMMEKA